MSNIECKYIFDDGTEIITDNLYTYFGMTEPGFIPYGTDLPLFDGKKLISVIYPAYPEEDIIGFGKPHN
jgi:hypothetical protein